MSQNESEKPVRHTLPDVPGELDRALALVRFLREHCAWDASRTPVSLVPHLLEEAHEVVAAIRSGDRPALESELGDLLLNLAFQIVLGEEEGAFDAGSVAARLEEKMKCRHPHLFGLGEKEDWERMKARERMRARERRTAGEVPDGKGPGALDGLPADLDPLLRAHRIQDRVSGVGFDWSEPRGAWEKVAEELEEVREALERLEAEDPAGGRPGAGREELEEELGDLLFAVVNLTRLAGSHSSTALHGANRKFSRRFRRLEALARERGIDVGRTSLETLDGLWNELKREE